MSMASTWHHALARRPLLLGAIVMGALLAVFFSPVLFGDATFSTVEANQANTYPWAMGGDRPVLPPQSDQAQYTHPRQVFLHQAMADGVVPLWDPYTLGGHPAFASGPGLAYPPRLAVTLLLDPSWAHDLYLIGHLFAAGLAMVALMKQLGVGVIGALLAAVAWSFGSYSLGWIMLEPFAAVAALLPAALLLVRRWHDRRSWPPLLVAGLLLGLLYLGASNELALISFLVAAGYTASLALRRTVDGWHREAGLARVSTMAAPGVLVAAAVGVAAVGVVPFVELMGRVGRAGVPYAEYLDSTYPADRSTTAADFLRALVPPHTPLDTATLVSQSAFVGTAAALAALPALFLRRPGTGLGRATTAVTFLFVIGTPVTWVGYHLVPGLASLNGLARSLFVWNLGLAVLAGIGLDATLGWLRRAVAGRGRGGHPLLLLLRTVGLLCIVATAGQLVAYGRRANPPFQRRDPALLFPSTPAVGALRQAQGPAPGEGRALALSRVVGGQPPPDGSPFLGMAGNAGQALGLRLVNGYENAVPDRTLQLWRHLRGEDLATVVDEPPSTTLNLVFPSDRVLTELLPRLGIAAVFAPPQLLGDPGWAESDLVVNGLRRSYLGPDGVVLEVADPAPRAMVVTEAQVVPGADAARAALLAPGFDPRRSVILEEPIPPAADAGPTAGSGGSAVVWLDQGPGGARLSVTSAAAGWLVVLESFDPGWRATVDGEPVEVEQADFAFQAIRIPAGTSAVELAYRPPEVLWGAAASGVTTAAILAVVVADGVRRRRRHRSGAGLAPEAPTAP